jgi:hypothetical protein
MMVSRLILVRTRAKVNVFMYVLNVASFRSVNGSRS